MAPRRSKTGPQAALSSTRPQSVLLEPVSGAVSLPSAPSPLTSAAAIVAMSGTGSHEARHRRTRHYHGGHRVMKWWHFW